MSKHRMKHSALFCAVFASVSLAADDHSKLPPLPKEIEAAVATARSAPPEIFADAMVRMVQGGKIPSIAWQKVLLQDAFTAAQQAREPVRLIPLPELTTD